MADTLELFGGGTEGTPQEQTYNNQLQTQRDKANAMLQAYANNKNSLTGNMREVSPETAYVSKVANTMDLAKQFYAIGMDDEEVAKYIHIQENERKGIGYNDTLNELSDPSKSQKIVDDFITVKQGYDTYLSSLDFFQKSDPETLARMNFDSHWTEFENSLKSSDDGGMKLIASKLASQNSTLRQATRLGISDVLNDHKDEFKGTAFDTSRDTSSETSTPAAPEEWTSNIDEHSMKAAGLTDNQINAIKEDEKYFYDFMKQYKFGQELRSAERKAAEKDSTWGRFKDFFKVIGTQLLHGTWDIISMPYKLINTAQASFTGNKWDDPAGKWMDGVVSDALAGHGKAFTWTTGIVGSVARMAPIIVATVLTGGATSELAAAEGLEAAESVGEAIEGVEAAAETAATAEKVAQAGTEIAKIGGIPESLAETEEAVQMGKTALQWGARIGNYWAKAAFIAPVVSDTQDSALAIQQAQGKTGLGWNMAALGKGIGAGLVAALAGKVTGAGLGAVPGVGKLMSSSAGKLWTLNTIAKTGIAVGEQTATMYVMGRSADFFAKIGNEGFGQTALRLVTPVNNNGKVDTEQLAHEMTDALVQGTIFGAYGTLRGQARANKVVRYSYDSVKLTNPGIEAIKESFKSQGVVDDIKAMDMTLKYLKDRGVTGIETTIQNNAGKVYAEMVTEAMEQTVNTAKATAKAYVDKIYSLTGDEKFDTTKNDVDDVAAFKLGLSYGFPHNEMAAKGEKGFISEEEFKNLHEVESVDPSQVKMENITNKKGKVTGKRPVIIKSKSRVMYDKLGAEDKLLLHGLQGDEKISLLKFLSEKKENGNLIRDIKSQKPVSQILKDSGKTWSEMERIYGEQHAWSEQDHIRMRQEFDKDVANIKEQIATGDNAKVKEAIKDFSTPQLVDMYESGKLEPTEFMNLIKNQELEELPEKYTKSKELVEQLELAKEQGIITNDDYKKLEELINSKQFDEKLVKANLSDAASKIYNLSGDRLAMIEEANNLASREWIAKQYEKELKSLGYEEANKRMKQRIEEQKQMPVPADYFIKSDEAQARLNEEKAQREAEEREANLQAQREAIKERKAQRMFKEMQRAGEEAAKEAGKHLKGEAKAKAKEDARVRAENEYVAWATEEAKKLDRTTPTYEQFKNAQGHKEFIEEVQHRHEMQQWGETVLDNFLDEYARQELPTAFANAYPKLPEEEVKAIETKEAKGKANKIVAEEVKTPEVKAKLSKEEKAIKKLEENKKAAEEKEAKAKELAQAAADRENFKSQEEFERQEKEAAEAKAKAQKELDAKIESYKKQKEAEEKAKLESNDPIALKKQINEARTKADQYFDLEAQARESGDWRTEDYYKEIRYKLDDTVDELEEKLKNLNVENGDKENNMKEAISILANSKPINVKGGGKKLVSLDVNDSPDTKFVLIKHGYDAYSAYTYDVDTPKEKEYIFKDDYDFKNPVEALNHAMKYVDLNKEKSNVFDKKEMTPEQDEEKSVAETVKEKAKKVSEMTSEDKIQQMIKETDNLEYGLMESGKYRFHDINTGKPTDKLLDTEGNVIEKDAVIFQPTNDGIVILQYTKGTLSGFAHYQIEGNNIVEVPHEPYGTMANAKNEVVLDSMFMPILNELVGQGEGNWFGVKLTLNSNNLLDAVSGENAHTFPTLTTDQNRIPNAGMKFNYRRPRTDYEILSDKAVEQISKVKEFEDAEARAMADGRTDDAEIYKGVKEEYQKRYEETSKQMKDSEKEHKQELKEKEEQPKTTQEVTQIVGEIVEEMKEEISSPEQKPKEGEDISGFGAIAPGNEKLKRQFKAIQRVMDEYENQNNHKITIEQIDKEISEGTAGYNFAHDGMKKFVKMKPGSFYEEAGWNQEMYEKLLNDPQFMQLLRYRHGFSIATDGLIDKYFKTAYPSAYKVEEVLKERFDEVTSDKEAKVITENDLHNQAMDAANQRLIEQAKEFQKQQISEQDEQLETFKQQAKENIDAQIKNHEDIKAVANTGEIREFDASAEHPDVDEDNVKSPAIVLTDNSTVVRVWKDGKVEKINVATNWQDTEYVPISNYSEDLTIAKFKQEGKDKKLSDDTKQVIQKIMDEKIGKLNEQKQHIDEATPSSVAEANRQGEDVIGDNLPDKYGQDYKKLLRAIDEKAEEDIKKSDDPDKERFEC